MTIAIFNHITFDIRHLNWIIITESSFPLPCFIHLVLQAAVHHAKLQLKTGVILSAFMHQVWINCFY